MSGRKLESEMRRRGRRQARSVGHFEGRSAGHRRPSKRQEGSVELRPLLIKLGKCKREENRGPWPPLGALRIKLTFSTGLCLQGAWK